jgi:hypothetical protein
MMTFAWGSIFRGQRKAGVPVLPLRVICGLDAPQRRNNQIGNARVLAGTPKPRGRKWAPHHAQRSVGEQRPDGER